MKWILIMGVGCMAAVNAHVCNLDRIYGNEFQYSLPRNILESFLEGKAFDHKESYTPQEREALHEDIDRIYKQIMEQGPLQQPVAVITAGSPGCGKTFLMRQDREKQEGHSAYIDPDDVCLRNMESTYKAELRKEGEGSPEVRKRMYDKWRPASNAANHIILANLIREGVAFHFGTTSSSPLTGKFFEFLKARGYTIRLLHVTAPDEVRWGSIQERDKTFVQTTEEDVRKKAIDVPQRIQDAYLKYADEIEFYYRGGVHEAPVCAGKWTRGGTLQVLDQDACDKIKQIHNTVCDKLGKPELLWERVFSL